MLMYGGPLDRQVIDFPDNAWSMEFPQLNPWPAVNMTKNIGTNTSDVEVLYTRVSYLRYRYGWYKDLENIEKFDVFVHESVDPQQVEDEMQAILALNGVFS